MSSSSISISISKGTVFHIPLNGVVVKGFNRGSKLLGTPTANIEPKGLEDIAEGVYYGLASVLDKHDEFLTLDGNSRVFHAAISVGYNVFFGAQKKTLEVHLIHSFENDFYGSELRLIILGYIRSMTNFPDTETLIKTIKEDIDYANQSLDKPENKIHETDPFLVVQVRKSE